MHWNPRGDARSSDELKAEWEELGRRASAACCPAHAQRFIDQQDAIGYELEMRKIYKAEYEYSLSSRYAPTQTNRLTR